jgi:molybdate transport system ATP-binding protein
MTLAIRLRHAFPGFTLDVDITAGPGVTALFGRSGSGKTTIINAVAGLLRPDAGRITLDDTPLLDTATGIAIPPHRRRIGYVFQDARLFPHLTVRQNLLYGRRFTRAASGPDLAHITTLLGLAPLLARRPGTLSGGEKQRVALGRAILASPRLLLMDEPLAALDDARKAEILPYLERLRDDLRLPILYVSHSLSEVARLADTVVLIDAGRVTTQGSAAQVLSDPAAAQSLGLREAGALLTARLAAHEADGLSRLDTAAGPIWLPRLSAPHGSPIKLRILAQDVMIATTRPQGISALNILPVTVTDIRMGEGPGALVRLALGPDHILARITRRSVAALDLAPGRQVFAVLKAVSVAQENVTPAQAPAPTAE